MYKKGGKKPGRCHPPTSGPVVGVRLYFLRPLLMERTIPSQPSSPSPAASLFLSFSSCLPPLSAKSSAARNLLAMSIFQLSPTFSKVTI